MWTTDRSAHMDISMTSLNNCSGLLVVRMLGNIHVYSKRSLWNSNLVFSYHCGAVATPITKTLRRLHYVTILLNIFQWCFYMQLSGLLFIS